MSQGKYQICGFNHGLKFFDRLSFSKILKFFGVCPRFFMLFQICIRIEYVGFLPKLLFLLVFAASSVWSPAGANIFSPIKRGDTIVAYLQNSIEFDSKVGEKTVVVRLLRNVGSMKAGTRFVGKVESMRPVVIKFDRMISPKNKVEAIIATGKPIRDRGSKTRRATGGTLIEAIFQKQSKVISDSGLRPGTAIRITFDNIR